MRPNRLEMSRPTAVMAAMHTQAIRPTSRPYSTSEAPSSSLAKNFLTAASLSLALTYSFNMESFSFKKRGQERLQLQTKGPIQAMVSVAVHGLGGHGIEL